jgi:5-methylcytosine-specific restriction protein A
MAMKTWGSSQPVPRTRGRRLQRLRKRLFDQHPLCVLCEAQGRATTATIRDHVIPLAEGGRDDETNVQALCRECSDAKTGEDSKRGRARMSVSY